MSIIVKIIACDVCCQSSYNFAYLCIFCFCLIHLCRLSDKDSSWMKFENEDTKTTGFYWKFLRGAACKVRAKLEIGPKIKI